MSDNEFRLQREVRELKTEVKRLRRTVEGGFIAIGLAAAIVFPQLLLWVLGLAGSILFAFLVSPVRRMIFSSIFQRRDGQ